MRIINVVLAVGPSIEHQWLDGRTFISCDPPRRPVWYLPRSADAELVFPQQPMRRHVWGSQLNAELKAIDFQQAQNNRQAIKTQPAHTNGTVCYQNDGHDKELVWCCNWSQTRCIYIMGIMSWTNRWFQWELSSRLCNIGWLSDIPQG